MANEITTAPPRTMMIKNLCPGLMEMGKIKIGKKGAVRKSGSGTDWQPPQKLDHFLITTMQRGEDGNYLIDQDLHKKFGEKPTSIPVRLIYDDIALNFATRYICYYGKTVFCSGDGEVAQRLGRDKKTYSLRQCPCGRSDPKYTGDNGENGPDNLGGNNSKGKCKINGILSAIIDGAEVVGGVWKFRTTSYNSVVGILSSLALISRITGGRLAGIPLNMTVTPKTVQDPIQGNQQTIYVVGLQFMGSMAALRDTGYQIAMDEAKHGISMAHIEEQAMRLLSYTPAAGLGDDIPEDVIDEFYPEEAHDHAPPPALVDEPNVIVKIDTDGYVSGVEVRTTETAPTHPPRERGKAAPGMKRRTKEQIAEDAEADRIDAEKQQTPVQDGAAAGCDHPEESQYQEGPSVICGSCGDVLSTEEASPGVAPFPDLTEEAKQETAATSGPATATAKPVIKDIF